MICTVVPDYPCSHVVPIIFQNGSGNLRELLSLTAFLNSFVFDFALRLRIGTGVAYLGPHNLFENPIPNRRDYDELTGLTARIALDSPIFSPYWMELKETLFGADYNIEKSWAVTRFERVRLSCMIDAMIALNYGLDYEDLSYILRFDSSDPKGFWRIDKNEPIEIRQTTLTLAAFLDLKEKGVDSFIHQNNGEGWMIPSELRFSIGEDGIIDFRDPDATLYGNVAGRLGPRYFDWQMRSTAEKSQADCIRHSLEILGEDGFSVLLERLKNGASSRRIQCTTHTCELGDSKHDEELVREKHLINQKKLLDY